MLQKEEEIRMSNWYIKKCDESYKNNEFNGWLRIAEEIQIMVANDFGYTDSFTNMLAVNYMRRAPNIYPDDKRFKLTQVYVRNNLAEQLNIDIGNILPSCNIIGMDKKLYTLSDIYHPTKYNLIIGSSAS